MFSQCLEHFVKCVNFFLCEIESTIILKITVVLSGFVNQLAISS